MRKLIINADDFGLTEGVNFAISDCFLEGVLTSATLMVNTQATDHAVKLVMSSEYRNLGVGLHFNLTLGKPISPAEHVPSLINGAGEFHGRSDFNKRMMLGLIKAKHIRTELLAQYQRFLSYGIEPTHIDGHQHVQAFQSVFACVADLCLDQNLAIRVPWVLALSQKKSLLRKLKQAYLSHVIQQSTRGWEGRLRWNSSLSSIFDLEIKELSELSIDHYRNLFEYFESGVNELMVHPAQSAAEQKGLTRIGETSEAEWRIMRTSGFKDLIAEGDFQLCHFGNAWVNDL